MTAKLLPCPFCGGTVRIERTTSYYDRLHGERNWWGVVCRNTENVGGTCAIQQHPSASEKTAADRWNRRATPPAASQPNEPKPPFPRLIDGTHLGALLRWQERRIADLTFMLAAPQPPAASQPSDEIRDVIDAARAAMDASTENGDDDIVIPSHLAASLSLCLDVHDAIAAVQEDK